MKRDTVQKLGLLSTLYFAQGLPFGFFTQALPVLLREQGTSLAAIGLSNLLALPWALKFLWGPLVDRYGSERFGQRRSWIVPLQACGVLLLIGLSFFPPSAALLPLVIAVGLTNLVAATQDVATDGLAVDVLEPEERGWGNGIQVAGYRAGMILGGGVLLWLLGRIGWQNACLGLALGLALSTLPILFTREPKRARPSEVPAATALWRALTRPGVRSWLLLLGAFKAGDALASAMLRPFLTDSGVTREEIAWMLGMVGFVTGLLGALAGGGSVALLGRRRALALCGLLQASGLAAYGVVAAGGAPSLGALTAICGWEHFAGGTATAALFTLMMDTCRPEHAATDYTLQACVVVGLGGVAASLSGVVTEQIGYRGVFWAGALLSVLGTLLLARDPRVRAVDDGPQAGVYPEGAGSEDVAAPGGDA